MAFNSAALKGLFSKLKPAAKAVANYGDDVAKAATTYGDDVARAVANYGDDLGSLAKYTPQDFDNIGALAPANIDNDFLDAVWDDSKNFNLDSPGLNIRGKQFHWPNGNSPQDQLKARLMDARSPAAWDVRDVSPLPSVVEGSMDASQALDNFTELGGFWGGVPSTTSVLGDVRGSIAAEDIVPGGVAGTFVQTPELPTKGLVMQDTTGLGTGYLDEFGLRPHKNTALGKWFEKQVPSYRWDRNYFEKPPF